MYRQDSILCAFDTRLQAEQAVKELQISGFDMKNLTIVGKDYHTKAQPVGFYSTGDRVKSWVGTGSIWGALWGLLFGAILFWTPGLGSVNAAEPLMDVLLGAAEGAVLIGALSALVAVIASISVPKNSVIKYKTEVIAEKYLLVAQFNQHEMEQARSFIRQTKFTSHTVFNV